MPVTRWVIPGRRWSRRGRSQTAGTRRPARPSAPCTARLRTPPRPAAPPAEPKWSRAPSSRRGASATAARARVPAAAGLVPVPAGAGPAFAAPRHPVFQERAARAVTFGHGDRDGPHGLPPHPVAGAGLSGLADIHAQQPAGGSPLTGTGFVRQAHVPLVDADGDQHQDAQRATGQE